MLEAIQRIAQSAGAQFIDRVAGAVEYYYIISIVNGLSGAYDVYRFA